MSMQSQGSQLIGRKNKRCELKEWQRLQVVQLKAKGLSHRAIGAAVGCSHTAVGLLCRKVKEEGTIRNRKRSGRRRKTTAKDDAFIALQAKQNPMQSSREISETLATGTATISPATVRRRLRETCLRSHVVRAKPLMTKSAAQKRLAFAKKYVNMPLSFWQKVIFSDESKFELISNRRKTRMWRPKGYPFWKRIVRNKAKHSQHVMVWGCFSWHGTGHLVFIRERLTAAGYVDIINNHLMLSAMRMGIQDNFILQQDNDPKHTARLTQEYMREMGLQVLEWPSYSPDLNPIEHAWDEQERQVPLSARRNMRTFESRMKTVWENMEVSRLQALVRSMPDRLAACIAAKGYYTRY